jgi:hypothetical protein
MASAGEIVTVRDEGTIWQIFYRTESNGVGVVNFDWRMFAQMYESETGRSFTEDYQSRGTIQRHLTGLSIRVAGEPFDQTVTFEAGPEESTRSKPPLRTAEDYLRRYPRICAHIICHSLGYAAPTTAARILMDAHGNAPNYCEWIWSCYGTDAKKAVQGAIRGRHAHHGYMADFNVAYGLVRRAIDSGQEPLFGSWF